MTLFSIHHHHQHFHEHDGRLDTLTSLLRQLLARVALVHGAIDNLTKLGARMSPELTALKQRVAEQTTLVHSAVQLINGLSARISAVAEDPDAVRTLADDLGNSSAELTAALATNTPQQAAVHADLPPEVTAGAGTPTP